MGGKVIRVVKCMLDALKEAFGFRKGERFDFDE
jgi:hypothetical protein